MRIFETEKQKQYREQYLSSSHWQELRRRKLKQQGACQKCGTHKYRHIHHLNYERRGHELLSDLIVLCGIHHLELHRGVITLDDILKPKKQFNNSTPLSHILKSYNSAFHKQDFTKIDVLLKKINIADYCKREQEQILRIKNRVSKLIEKQNKRTL